MTDEIRRYMAEIGKKGGASGKGQKWRSEACRHAAVVRWRTYREQKRLRAEKRERERSAVGLVEDLEAESRV